MPAGAPEVPHLSCTTDTVALQPEGDALVQVRPWCAWARMGWTTWRRARLWAARVRLVGQTARVRACCTFVRAPRPMARHIRVRTPVRRRCCGTRCRTPTHEALCRGSRPRRALPRSCALGHRPSPPLLEPSGMQQMQRRGEAGACWRVRARAVCAPRATAALWAGWTSSCRKTLWRHSSLGHFGRISVTGNMRTWRYSFAERRVGTMSLMARRSRLMLLLDPQGGPWGRIELGPVPTGAPAVPLCDTPLRHTRFLYLRLCSFRQ